jgi:hypothetical protein
LDRSYSEPDSEPGVIVIGGRWTLDVGPRTLDLGL